MAEMAELDVQSAMLHALWGGGEHVNNVLTAGCVDPVHTCIAAALFAGCLGVALIAC